MEFFDFAGHPLAAELERRVSRILRCMALLRHSAFSLYRAQLAIVEDLLHLEASLRECRSEASALRARANELALQAKKVGGKLSDAEKRQAEAIQNQARDYDTAVRILRYGRWMYRYVGDAIAWRVYGYNRTVIRALGGKEPVPFLSGNEGLERELRFFRAIRRLGRQWLPLMHDITNCIRTADFTVFKNGRIERIIELKIRKSHPSPAQDSASDEPRSSREARQVRRVRNVFEYLATGDMGKLSPDLAGGRLFSSQVPEWHNFQAVSNVIAKSRRRGFGFEEPDPGILYVAWRIRRDLVDEALLQASKAHPQVFGTLFTFRSISPRYEKYHVSLPIAAMDLPVRAITDVLFGRIGVMCFLNFASVEQYCRDHGVPLTFHHGPSGIARITVGTGPAFGEVQEGLWNRLLLEALSLASFAGMIKAIMDAYGEQAAPA